MEIQLNETVAKLKLLGYKFKLINESVCIAVNDDRLTQFIITNDNNKYHMSSELSSLYEILKSVKVSEGNRNIKVQDNRGKFGVLNLNKGNLSTVIECEQEMLDTCIIHGNIVYTTLSKYGSGILNSKGKAYRISSFEGNIIYFDDFVVRADYKRDEFKYQAYDLDGNTKFRNEYLKVDYDSYSNTYSFITSRGNIVAKGLKVVKQL